jgi:uncharacterized membrane protein (UPF0127 family)
MKNTPSPLDILFCRSGKIIALEKGKPFSEKHFGPNEESDNGKLMIGGGKETCINP